MQRPGGQVCAFPDGQPQRSRILRPTGVSKRWPRLPGQRTRDRAGAGLGWSTESCSSDALSTLRLRTYDAGTVSRSTATGRLYPVPAFAPWIAREASTPPPPRPRLLDRVREAIRARHYSRRTEKAYVHWIRRFIFFHDKRHPADMGAPEVTRFLSSLAVEGKVAASTQNQALSALLFLYGEVLAVDLPWMDEIVRAKRPQRLPVVLTRDEVRAVLRRLDGPPRLMAFLLYGAGLRLLECCRLRVQDVDFGTNQIVVRSGKGDKDRMTMLPAAARRGPGPP